MSNAVNTNTNAKVFNTLIIGAGNIASVFDEKDSEHYLTHAKAFSEKDKFNLVGFVDIDQEKAKIAAEKWNTKYFSTIPDTDIDIVCVANSTESHYSTLKELANYDIKAVFLEKPITETTSQAQEIMELYKSKDIKVLVNYTRRFVPEFESLSVRINTGEFGKFLSGQGYYCRGYLNNGSHLIDLSRFLIGTASDIKLTSIETKDYFTFELDLFFEKGRIRIIDLGRTIEIYKPEESELFKGYSYLSKKEEIQTSLDKSMKYAAQNLYNHLCNGEDLKCSIEEAYKTMEQALK